MGEKIMTLFCQNFQAHAFSPSNKTFIRLRCKKWDCSFCGGLNRYIWRKHLRAYVSVVGFENWSLVTVTARSKAHKHHTTMQSIIGSWDKLLKRLKRSWGSFDYVRVYERHESGEFHAHMLVRYYPDDVAESGAWRTYGYKDKQGFWRVGKRYRGKAHGALKRASFGVGLGYICDFSPVLVESTEDKEHAINRVVFYITKYMTKTLDNLPKGTRRIQTSRAIGSPKGEGDGTQDYSVKFYLSIDDVAEHGTIVDLTRKHDVSFDDFLEHATYPPLDESY